MKRLVSVTVAVVMLGGLAAAAAAQPGWGSMMAGPGFGPMGARMAAMPGRMGAGRGPCAGVAAGAPATPDATAPVTEDKAKALATDYAAKYFKGYTVERVVPFQGRFQTAWQVELKGPKGDTRILHVNPWGGVRPFGPFAGID
jgi:hypothetical protein